MKRVALCGGTFDPFHRAHLEAPVSVAGELGWSEIVYIPAHRQPFKAGKKMSSPFHRHAMAVLGTIDEPRARVSLVELERPKISFTVDTLEQLESEEPETVFDWVIGDDNLEALTEWRSLDRILELANFVVLQRNAGARLPDELESRRVPVDEKPRNGAIMFVKNQTIPISSTEIRARVARGENIDGLVHPRVEHYILTNRLYIEAEH